MQEYNMDQVHKHTRHNPIVFACVENMENESLCMYVNVYMYMHCVLHNNYACE